MMYFFLPENFNGLIRQGPWVLYDSAQHKKREPDMGLCLFNNSHGETEGSISKCIED
jgi:hypothetical protein